MSLTQRLMVAADGAADPDDDLLREAARRIEELEMLANVAAQCPTVCPFCGEQDFDMIGLKMHFERGWCDAYNETP